MQISPFQNRGLGIFGVGEYAPTQIPSNIYVSQEHPCNGMGGLNCECGGWCKGNSKYQGLHNNGLNTENTSLIQNSSNYNEQIDSQIDSILQNEDVVISSQMNAIPISNLNHSGLIISTSFMSSGSVVSEIQRIYDRKRLAAVVYVRNEDNNGWAVMSSKDRQVIPNEATANDFNSALFSAYIAKEILSSKVAEVSNRNLNISIPQKPQGDDCYDEVANSHTISHDLICTGVGDVWRLSVPCTETYVNLNSCCLTHDIDLWCGPSDAEQIIPGGILEWITRLNLALAACVAGKVFEAYLNADIPWYCGGKITGIILGAIAAVVMGAVFLVATEAAVLLMWGALDERLGLVGQHKDSCLCGGETPTVLGCRDLCAEKGIKPDCYDCHWECVYDKGIFVGKRWVVDETGKQKCCPSSTRECRNDCDGNSKYCPTCSNCAYFCLPNEKGIWDWRIKKNYPDLTCCDGQPSPHKGKCDKNHHGGFINH